MDKQLFFHLIQFTSSDVIFLWGLFVMGQSWLWAGARGAQAIEAHGGAMRHCSDWHRAAAAPTPPQANYSLWAITARVGKQKAKLRCCFMAIFYLSFFSN